MKNYKKLKKTAIKTRKREMSKRWRKMVEPTRSKEILLSKKTSIAKMRKS